MEMAGLKADVREQASRPRVRRLRRHVGAPVHRSANPSPGRDRRRPHGRDGLVHARSRGGIGGHRWSLPVGEVDHRPRVAVPAGTAGASDRRQRGDRAGSILGLRVHPGRRPHGRLPRPPRAAVRRVGGMARRVGGRSSGQSVSWTTDGPWTAPSQSGPVSDSRGSTRRSSRSRRARTCCSRRSPCRCRSRSTRHRGAGAAGAPHAFRRVRPVRSSRPASSTPGAASPTSPSSTAGRFLTSCGP